MQEITQLLSHTFKISLDDAANNLQVADVDTWDSLTHMDLIVAIEDTYKIQLTGDEIADMQSFSEIRKIITNYIN